MVTKNTPHPRIVLASGSRYRAAALRQIGLHCERFAPDIDEAQHEGEAPAAMALRLSEAKVHAARDQHPDAVIIGGDQVGLSAGQLLRKPGDAAANIAQLRTLSGREAIFHSGLAVYAPATRSLTSCVIVTQLQFRHLSEQEIETCVAADQAWDCAGGFKIESRGITLFSRVRSDDPSALVGLPLIALTSLLRRIPDLDFSSAS